MDARLLLLLGLLKDQSQHGYQLNEFIERNLGHITDMKKATAYALLDKLEEAGHISVRVEQEGNRPPRKVYAITPAGEAEFQSQLRETLAEADEITLAGNIGLMFIDSLPREAATGLLRRRLAHLAGRIEEIAATPAHGHRPGVNLAVERQLVLLRADREWLASVILRLQGVQA